MTGRGDGDSPIYDDDGDVPVYGPETGADAEDAIPVGIAEYAVTDGTASLKTSGLGSCIGVVVHDEFAGVSGLLHFMLPEADGAGSRYQPAAKCADTGIESMLSEVTALGGDPARSWAKVAGGATMVDFHQTDRSIGERNVEAVRRELDVHDIPIRGTDFGGGYGRSLEFDPATGTLTVNSAGGVEKEL